MGRSGFAGAAGVPADASVESRIGAMIEPQPDGCWLFRGEADRYGQVSIDGRHLSVHRWVYETLIGELDEGALLHHLCHTKGCCNPLHLEELDGNGAHMARHALERREGVPINGPQDALQRVRWQQRTAS